MTSTGDEPTPRPSRFTRWTRRSGGGLGASGWTRTLLLRRVLAFALVTLAMVIAVRPEPSDTAPLILVAAHDLAPGSPLRAEDVRQRRTPTDLVPLGALREPEDVTDRVLVGAARQGEPLTDVRLVNSSVRAAFSTGDSTTNVPLRLSDPEIGDYLYAGCRVDVVALSPGSRDSPLLAADARVVAIRSGGTGQAKGRLIVVELSRATAARVAAVALEQPVTVTLR